MKLKGKVIVKPFGKGSKSEHDAIWFKTDSGEYLLRELGANPFNNEKLQALVGKELTLEGIIEDNKFLLPVNSLNQGKRD